MIVKFIGAAIFAASLFVLYHAEQTGLLPEFRLIFWPAIILTLIGPFGLLLLSTDFEQLKETFQFMFRESLRGSRKHIDQEYALLRKLGGDFYIRGPRVFAVKDASVSTSIAKMLEKLSIRIPMIDAIDLLERDRDQVADRLEQSIALLALGSRLSPSVGMLGTIIGMSQLLSHLKEPENIGPSMSVALLTTFYGLFFSLSLWTPLQNHLHRLLDLKMRSFDQALHWLELLQKRKPADYLGEEVAKESAGKDTQSSSVNRHQSSERPVEGSSLPIV
jgi:flagellar motor component MotA